MSRSISWMKSLFGETKSTAKNKKEKEKQIVSTEHKNRLSDLGNLWFLVDIPLFIDATSISQLFDAMVRPEWQPVSRVRTESDIGTLSGGVEAGAKAKGNLPFFLSGEVTGKVSGSASSQTGKSSALSEQTNQSPEMNLEKIVNRYVNHIPDRLFSISSDLKTLTDVKGNSFDWNEVDDLLDGQGMRPLVVLDFPAGVKILPMFAETIDGKSMELHLDLKCRLGIGKEHRYPSRSDEDFDEKALAHWNLFADRFDSMEAIQCVETVEKRINWIAFRAWPKLNNGELPLHLSILPAGNYANGTFAYQFIRRAQNFGIRMIGTVKKGKDINILAIYER